MINAIVITTKWSEECDTGVYNYDLLSGYIQSLVDQALQDDNYSITCDFNDLVMKPIPKGIVVNFIGIVYFIHKSS